MCTVTYEQQKIHLIFLYKQVKLYITTQTRLYIEYSLVNSKCVNKMSAVAKCCQNHSRTVANNKVDFCKVRYGLVLYSSRSSLNVMLSHHARCPWDRTCRSGCVTGSQGLTYITVLLIYYWESRLYSPTY
ncbi:hypothetical protein NP493_466g05007 [Ridgeia piscesae]|uniref:Uncharacterized protein n=1 Tax=Ridgeia piscesae TaxID=27915 RepID=A0AAD9L026_RIDPI|nr:hypothetical protein NP493_466g05007 [Ridgeia piscesae]